MTRNRLAAAGAVAVAGVAAWAAFVEPRLLAVRRRTVALAGWPDALDGLTVAAVADLHAGAPQIDAARVREVVAAVNERGPDVVVLLGDHVDDRHLLGAPVAPAAVAAALGELRAPRGVFAVLGNHDWRNAGERMGAALAAEGIVVLENGAAPAGPGLWVAGVGDPTHRIADVERALAAVGDDDAAVLLLTHDPDVFPRVPVRPALTLAGHTHGGQVDVPLLRRRWIPSRFGARYAGGWVREHGRRMYVSPGIGTSRVPVRLGARPEVPVLRLRVARHGFRRRRGRRRTVSGWTSRS